MAIIEWKGRSGIGGHLNGDLTLASEADVKVYDAFVVSLRSSQVLFFLSIPYVELIYYLEEEILYEPPQKNLALFQ